MTYLDTHAALWLCTSEVPLSEAALHEIESAEIRLSPVVLMEIQFLQEIGRLNHGPEEWLKILRTDFDVAVCPLPFHAVVEASYKLTWTRDPFDRLIVAHAITAGGKLISRDRRIRDNFEGALW